MRRFFFAGPPAPDGELFRFDSAGEFMGERDRELLLLRLPAVLLLENCKSDVAIGIGRECSVPSTCFKSNSSAPAIAPPLCTRGSAR